MTDKITLKVGGQTKTVDLSEAGLTEAHGTGLDGVSRVESLLYGTSPEFPGKIFVQDGHGNAIMTTPDELFAAVQHVAPDWTIGASKK